MSKTKAPEVVELSTAQLEELLTRNGNSPPWNGWPFTRKRANR